MKKRLLCLSLIFAMTAAQVMPVSAARKDDLQAEKSATQSKLSAAESKANSLESQKQKQEQIVLKSRRALLWDRLVPLNRN